jgi:hypothetical protein
MGKEEGTTHVNQLSSDSSKNKLWIWILLVCIALVVIIILVFIFIPKGEKPIENLYETSTNGDISINSEVYMKEEFQAKSQEEAVLDASNIDLIKFINCVLDNSEDENLRILCTYFINQDSLRSIYGRNSTYFQKYSQKMIFNMSYEGKGKEEMKKAFQQMLTDYSKIYDTSIITCSLDEFNKADIEISNVKCSDNISFTLKNKGSTEVELILGVNYNNTQGERVSSYMGTTPNERLGPGETRAFSFEKQKFIGAGPTSQISERGIEKVEIQASIDSPQAKNRKEWFRFNKDCS